MRELESERGRSRRGYWQRLNTVGSGRRPISETRRDKGEGRRKFRIVLEDSDEGRICGRVGRAERGSEGGEREGRKPIAKSEAKCQRQRGEGQKTETGRSDGEGSINEIFRLRKLRYMIGVLIGNWKAVRKRIGEPQ